MASGEAPERRGLPRLPLLLLIVAVVTATPPLVVLALRVTGDEPIAVVEEQDGPFRGGVLPPELSGSPAPSFRHTDARTGEPFGTRDVAGRPYAVTFLYADCPDVCPLIGQELKQALEALGPRSDQVAVLAISTDPRGDTPEAVTAWLERHDLPRNFHYLLGSEAELEPTWDAYFAAPQVPGAPESTHTASIWLVDSSGRLRTKFSAGAPVPPADIAHDLTLLLDDANRRAAERPDVADGPGLQASWRSRSGSEGSIRSGSP